MNLDGKIVVVTGAAHGIGRALAIKFAKEGAEGIIVADIEGEDARKVATEIRGLAITTDVSQESDIQHLVEQAIATYGRIDLFCSNAGIGSAPGGVEVANETWQAFWDTNLMPHLYAARAVIPGMVRQGGGYLLQTASAAGLLNHFESAPYAVSKHAVIALAEWLAITYADAGIRVSCLCPQGVQTRMLLGQDAKRDSFLNAGALAPEEVADIVVDGLNQERFLILPHPEVAEFYRRKADDPDRWLSGMRRLQRRILG